MSIEESEAVVPVSAAFRAAMLAVRVRSVVIAIVDSRPNGERRVNKSEARTVSLQKVD